MSEWEAEEGEHWATNAERYTKVLAGYGEIITDAAGFSAGDRVLDVGCGNGDISIMAGHAVGSAGAVQGVDLSPAMLEVAASRATAEGLDNVRFARADAAAFQPNPAGFDVLVSRFGVMFFPDPTGAFTHLRSLMTPGGRLVFACWQDLFANDWMIIPGAAIAEVLPLPGGADPDAPGPFAFANAGRLRDILDTAGYQNVEIETSKAPMWMGTDAAETVDFLRSTGMGRALFSDAPPELVTKATRRAEEALAPFEGPDGVQLSGSAWLVTATA